MSVAVDHPQVAQLRKLVDQAAQSVAVIFLALMNLLVGLILEQRFHEALAGFERVEHLAGVFVHDVDGAAEAVRASLKCVS